MQENATIVRYLVLLVLWCMFAIWNSSPSSNFSGRYPAGHVRLHELLYSITDAGRDVRLAQYIYGVLYLTTLLLSCTIYRTAGSIPNWTVLLLPLSKRLHSIFVLRLFNDCWAIAAAQLAILLFQKGFYDSGMMIFRYVTLS